MQNWGRGPGRRGRGRGFPPPPTDFPSLLGIYSNKGESSQTVKDVLLTPETYFQNSITEETVLYIDTADIQWVSDPWEVKKRYLATQNSPPHLDTYRYVYEQILTELASVQFQHHYADSNRTASPINYSKATIQSIMPIQAWGIHPHVTRSLDIRYSYWDYITAFTQTFYYMNPPRSHSWFFRVLPDVLKNDLPSWFLIWWDTFGLQLDAFPEYVRLAFNEWQAIFSILPVNKNISMSKCLIHFVIRFSIPWIWKWDLQCDFQNKVPRLKRVFFYKWWKQMDDTKNKQDLLQRIKEHTQSCLDACPKTTPVIPTNPFIQIQQELRRKYPEITEEELVAKSMDFMKQQFLESMAPRDSSMKSASSEGEKTQPDPYSDDDNTFTPLAGESQDPNEDPSDPDFGDIWDSVTELITDKLVRAKGKGTRNDK
ncbi:uncharacterized protein LOC114296004 isoform X1 [Camellia sinensis]|uniref:uncharacterized protein LOC114296004 isoform X1 n=1 Tax=Camellia sinensis TaxID=4442 RepID=UPI00103576B4|nr:uncharacterized protein LOC114296004 isoform X1 [Camellia sinensis]XP_028096084.1 uncharacterized protein LOC114296004 isoform X1 [Camellia sinensis]XP_028096085.1 uncharacterized protein LOC114296004 isoform X1 [Camellia sinensis]